MCTKRWLLCGVEALPQINAVLSDFDSRPPAVSDSTAVGYICTLASCLCNSRSSQNPLQRVSWGGGAELL